MSKLLSNVTAQLLTAFRGRLSVLPSVVKHRKILCVSHDAGFYGAQLLILHIARLLKRELGMEVTTVLLGGGRLRADFEAIGPVVDFTSPNWRQPISRFEQGRRAVVLQRIHSNGYKHALCNTTVSGLLLPMLKSLGFQTLLLVHELPKLLEEFGLQEAVARVGRFADHVVFPAEFVRNRFEALCPLDALRVVVRPQGLYRPNPYRNDHASVRAELLTLLHLPQSAKLVVAAGSGDMRKGLDIFVQVAALVVHAQPEAQFVWIGEDGTELARTMKSWASAKGISEHLHFLGVLTDPDTYNRRIAAATLYLLTSREDPFPSVVLDAMTTGSPVVAFSGAGGFDGLLNDGAGVLVPMEDCEAMASAVCRLLGQEGEASIMGAAGKSIIDTRFGFADYVHDLLALLGHPQPRVSVIVPNYNCARKVPERLASIFAQAYRPMEIIFLDDLSSDDSVALATALLTESGLPHRVVTSEQHSGPYAQWIKGLELARGDVVWIAEIEDLCDPTFLGALAPAFTDTSVTLAYCQTRIIDDHSMRPRSNYLDNNDLISTSKWLSPFLRDGQAEIGDSLAVKNTISNVSAVLMRRAALKGLESTLQGLTVTGAWLTYVHVLEMGQVFFNPLALHSHRLNSNIPAEGGQAERQFSEFLHAQNRIASRHPLTPQTQAQVEVMRQFAFEHLGLKSAQYPVYLAHPASQQAVRS